MSSRSGDSASSRSSRRNAGAPARVRQHAQRDARPSDDHPARGFSAAGGLSDCSSSPARSPRRRGSTPVSRSSTRPTSIAATRSLERLHSRFRRWVLAGAPGFEPGNGGIKIRCLTTWLRPTRASTPRDSQGGATISAKARSRNRGAPSALSQSEIGRLVIRSSAQIGACSVSACLPVTGSQ